MLVGGTLGIAFSWVLVSCITARPAAEAAYLAEQLQCVDRADTRAEADACRTAVKARWDGGQ